MAVVYNQLQSAFSKMLNRERYSRFTLQPDGGGHVEVKLSDDVTDDQAGAEQTGQPGDSPSYRPRPRQEYRRICYLALGALFIFVIGCLIGYASTHSEQEPIHCSMNQEAQIDGVQSPPVQSLPVQPTPVQPTPVPPPPEQPSLSWKSITNLLTTRLTPDKVDQGLSCLQFQYDQTAGSDGDVILANNVFNNFKIWEMNPWTDVHYVQLQKPDSEKPNRVLMDQVVVGQPKAYLAYSATGKVQGTAVYGNYGRKEDLEILTNLNIELNGTVILLRASGQISLAQQVANVAEMGVSAVLIYPDPDDYKFDRNTELYGHVHLGSGDPYTPGFPSFNHTQFPPTESSGLPTVLAQSITAATAAQIMKAIGGANVPSSFRGGLDDVTYRIGGAGVNVTVEVNNVLQNTEIHNVFGVIKGFVEPDHYVVLGAQRDSWGPGFAKAMVGTTLLMELARSVYEMVEKDGFRPRRSMVFASWSAGEFGSVGATEWLEGYMSSLDRRAFTYISLDGVVTGHGAFKASASPLLVSLLATTMQEVKNPIGSDMSKSLYDKVSGANFEASVLEPMQMEDAAYPFLAFSGIPSISLRFVSRDSEVYPYYGTALDNIDHLGVTTNQRLDSLATAAGLVAGQMALRLVHDHVLNLDVRRYITPISQAVVKINKRLKQVTEGRSAEGLSANWLIMARGSYIRATSDLNEDIQNTDLTDSLACHKINERIMRVEHNLLSPFVSPKDVPFRHVLFGHGSHTLDAMLEGTDKDVLRTQLALTTWTLQGCANALAGDIWELDNQI
ncbi:transferrin receptor 1b isoform X2 [Esox lucius]|uniref:transferrin receptor 1b isoform X2 n=1 Tax=Esox lucius TaxID=8010 RepID=UPI00147760A4|nr:transferrin receptor 1b isoform X2 [Esox lucius]